MPLTTRSPRALARQIAKKTRHSWDALVRGLRGLMTDSQSPPPAAAATREEDATTPPRTASQMASHLAATRATAVLASEHARLAEMTAARASVDAAVARRRVAMAAADARAFQLRLMEEEEQGTNRAALTDRSAARPRPYTTRDPLEIPDAQQSESGSEESSDNDQDVIDDHIRRMQNVRLGYVDNLGRPLDVESDDEADAAIREQMRNEERMNGTSLTEFRGHRGVRWRRDEAGSWRAIFPEEQQPRPNRWPALSPRQRDRVRAIEQHVNRLRNNAPYPQAVDLALQQFEGDRQAYEEDPSVEEREVFRALREEVALETAEDEDALTAREIDEVPTREHNLWVIMISLPGCSRTTADACLTRNDGNLEAAFHEAADQQRERWEGIAQIMAQFPWLTEADAETWYEACDENPTNAILTIRRHRRLATNPAYVQRVHERVTNVIARGNPTDVEATEAEAELLDSNRESISLVRPGSTTNVAVRRYEATNIAERLVTRAADPPRVTIETTDIDAVVDDGRGRLLPVHESQPSEWRPIAWMERSHAGSPHRNMEEALDKRLRMHSLESTRREALAIGGCAVCMHEERPAKVVFGGCGHLCVCQDCAHQLCTRYSSIDVLAPCPICRQVSAPVLVSAS